MLELTLGHRRAWNLLRAVLFGNLAQMFPRVEARGVAVRPDNLHGIAADKTHSRGLDAVRDRFWIQNPLAGVFVDASCARALAADVLERQPNGQFWPFQLKNAVLFQCPQCCGGMHF